MEIIQEGKARIKTYTAETVSRDMPVFYNPAMNLNRDINVLLLNSINKKNMQVALPLAATGIRGIRFLLELKKAKVKTISFNDRSIDAFKLFILNSKGFDYIDIDPFGSPNFFLDSAIKRLARGGILAVTATDTAALCGTSKNACLRKYSSKPLKNEFCHETGLRILISKVQSAGAQYDKALIPVFSYSKEHYFRVFFECEKGKKKADEIIKNYGYILHCKKCLFRENADSIFNDEKCPLCKSKLDYAGKIWLGQLYDKNLADKMNQEAKKSENKELIKLMKIISNESKINEVGFYDIAKVVKHNKLKNVPKKNLLISEIKKAGFKAAETHIRPNSIRSSITIKGLIKIIKKLN